ncbi:hypothetical protein KQX54_014090 [Cotesia glomerata]|uniref:Uncharacterized protein n=1 Tax=Cotesia glomerata TaxID=32391 RepID=A0AAV7I7A9_COTGL|nr:hypothetical protein KQX54_014090 [Cotesia glomerata]
MPQQAKDVALAITDFIHQVCAQRANEEKVVSKLIREIPRIGSLGSTRFLASPEVTHNQRKNSSRAGLDDFHQYTILASRVDRTRSILNNPTENQLTEIWQKLD